MQLKNSYIFLLRDEKAGKICENDILYLLRRKFNVVEDTISASELLEKQNRTKLKNIMRCVKTGTLIIKNKNIIETFKLSTADTTEYLDINLSGNKKSELINQMQIINDTIIGSQNVFKQHYIVILSYDSISEYYCNKVYSLLAKFERKFRKLLFIIYTSQLKKSYFEVTTSLEMQAKAKERIRKDNNDIRLQNYFYELDFGTMRELLFEKRWTMLDETVVEKFLDSNKDLSKLSDEALIKKIKSIHPVSDWVRFFSNKNLSNDFENVIKEINVLRNLVAHNKIFTQEDYNKLEKILKINIKIVDDAIQITEEDDFKQINNVKFHETLSLLGGYVVASIDKIYNVLKPTLKSFSDLSSAIINNKDDKEQ